jgi:hypothetical protein
MGEAPDPPTVDLDLECALESARIRNAAKIGKPICSLFGAHRRATKHHGFATRNAFAKPNGVVLLSSGAVTPSRLGLAHCE